MVNFLYKVISIITLLLIYEASFDILNWYKDRNILEKVASSIDISDSKSLHENIMKYKYDLIDNYLNAPKSNAQMLLWLNNRDYFRQTAVDTLSGQTALCGELSRVLIKTLRIRGIKARRLYLYGMPGTSHVLLEYFHPLDNEWRVINSWQSSDYMEHITSKPHTIEDIFASSKKEDLIYLHYSNFPINIVNKLGSYPYNIPYVISWLMEEVYILTATLMILLSSLLALILTRKKNGHICKF